MRRPGAEQRSDMLIRWARQLRQMEREIRDIDMYQTWQYNGHRPILSVSPRSPFLTARAVHKHELALAPWAKHRSSHKFVLNKEGKIIRTNTQFYSKGIFLYPGIEPMHNRIFKGFDTSQVCSKVLGSVRFVVVLKEMHIFIQQRWIQLTKSDSKDLNAVILNVIFIKELWKKV